MGEMADLIIDGACCALCGVNFEQPHGFPVACSSCWEEDCAYPQATEDETF